MDIQYSYIFILFFISARFNLTKLHSDLVVLDVHFPLERSLLLHAFKLFTKKYQYWLWSKKIKNNLTRARYKKDER